MFWKFAISALILPTCLGFGSAQASNAVPEQTAKQITLAANNLATTDTDTNLISKEIPNPSQLLAHNYYNGGCRYRRSGYYRRGYYNNGYRRSNYYHNGYGNNRYYRSNYYHRGHNGYHHNYYRNGGYGNYHRSNYSHW